MNCLFCNITLIGRQRKFCSLQCKNKASNPWYQSKEKQFQKGLDRKKSAIKEKGGACSLCGYKKNYASLVFHHINPKEKSFGIDMRKFSNYSWERISKEVNKCQLLCHNCHMEIEYPHLMVVGPE
jgi:5-methylcytosine-specific restriction endonuclease McrA